VITASTHGAPNWVDLATTDIDGAVHFYKSLLGWEVEKTASPMGDYYIGKVEGSQVAGMMAMSADQMEMPPMWTTFFNVDDVDEMVVKIEMAGGSVIQPAFDIPEARIAIVADPLGAMFGLFGGPEIEGTWLSRKSGAVCWVETMNRDTASAEAFYASIFDWKAETEIGKEMSYTTFHLEEEPIAGMLMMTDEIGPEVPAHWGLYFSVDVCKKAEEKTIELGGSVIRPTTEIPEMGSFAVLADPQGAVFQVMDFTG
jgi:predicted enzyme related to lactoylglutathione lyase